MGRRFKPPGTLVEDYSLEAIGNSVILNGRSIVARTPLACARAQLCDLEIYLY